MATGITKQDFELLKQYAQKQGFEKGSLQQERRVMELLSDPRNATKITTTLSADDLFDLIDSATNRIKPIEKWSTVQKVALVKKNIKFFSFFPYTFPGENFDDQELLKECLKAFNKKYPSPLERKDQYYRNFSLAFRHITFNQENFETLLKSLPDQSPFVFKEVPFNLIRNWRELIKSNPRLADQNQMLDAMDTLNALSKADFEQFIKQNKRLLKNPVFYNQVVQVCRKQVLDKIAHEEQKVADQIADLADQDRFDEAEQTEEKFNQYRKKALNGLNLITKNLSPYKQAIIEQGISQISST